MPDLPYTSLVKPKRLALRHDLTGVMPDPSPKARKPVAARGPLRAEIYVWVSGWMVQAFPAGFPIETAYVGHSNALLSGRYFDRAVYRAVIDMLRDEEASC